jgi:hypothetical protein
VTYFTHFFGWEQTVTTAARGLYLQIRTDFHACWRKRGRMETASPQNGRSTVFAPSVFEHREWWKRRQSTLSSPSMRPHAESARRNSLLMAGASHRKVATKLTEFADVVAFVASDGAVAMTGTVANLTGGIVVE